MENEVDLPPTSFWENATFLLLGAISAVVVGLALFFEAEPRAPGRGPASVPATISAPKETAPMSDLPFIQ